MSFQCITYFCQSHIYIQQLQQWRYFVISGCAKKLRQTRLTWIIILCITVWTALIESYKIPLGTQHALLMRIPKLIYEAKTTIRSVIQKTNSFERRRPLCQVKAKICYSCVQRMSKFFFLSYFLFFSISYMIAIYECYKYCSNILKIILI